MSYYPILEAPYCKGEVVLHNYPPNNWEITKKNKQYIYMSTIKGNKWHNLLVGELNYNQSRIIDSSEFDEFDNIKLLSLNEEKIPQNTKLLPILKTHQTLTPNWRSTLSLYSKNAKTSYQGEINPFPINASLLSFSPFLQFGDNIENYVLICNIENSPINRKVKICIYDTVNNELKIETSAYSNTINIISLDNAGFDKNSIPMIDCSNMAAIPIYFSCFNKGEFLSMEHTHPPASLVVHGNRFKAQSYLKKYWLSK